MTTPLPLPAQSLVARGAQRAVYLHPHDPTKLVKVLMPDNQRPKRNNFNGVMDRLMPSTRLRQIRKEYSEYLRIMLQNPHNDFHLPLTHMFGFVTTDQGLGCLTERITADNAPLGKTLGAAAKDGTLCLDDIALLNDSIGRIFDYNIRASDMNPSNFVFGQRTSAAGTLGPRECVLVDGFGDTHAIPVRSWGKWANRHGLEDSCKRLAHKTGLHWDSKQRHFSHS